MKFDFNVKIIVLSLTILSTTSCLKHKTVEPVEPMPTCTDTISFNNEIMTQVITPNCNTSGCHNSVDVAGNLDLSTYTNVSNSATVVLSTMKHDPNAIAMPLGAPKLNDSLIQKFYCWIEQGKLNN